MPDEKYYGKYRGLVLNNIDPLQMGRIQVQVPDVLALSISSWAMPCAPIAGPQMGIYAVPTIGAGVWVEFEGGNPDYPIWTGGFWGSAAEVPALALVPSIPASPNIALQTIGQNKIIVGDSPPTPVSGGIVLMSTTGARIVVNDSGIYIDNGKGASILMTGPTITVNNGALVVV